MRIIIALLMLLPATLRAQDEIETDRPDQTETATTVPPGSVQIEAGLVIERDETAFAGTFGGPPMIFESTAMVPTVLVRVGLIEPLELRLEAGYQNVETTVGSSIPVGGGADDAPRSVSGFAAPSFGVKLELLAETGPIPDLALIADVTLPVGHESFRPSSIAPAFRFSMAHTLSEDFSLGYNLGAEWSGEEADEPTGIYTLALGAGLSDHFGAYVELFGEVSSDGYPAHSFDGGVTFRPIDNLQLDLSGGIGLNAHALDRYFSLGASIRIPE